MMVPRNTSPQSTFSSRRLHHLSGFPDGPCFRLIIGNTSGYGLTLLDSPKLRGSVGEEATCVAMSTAHKGVFTPTQHHFKVTLHSADLNLFLLRP